MLRWTRLALIACALPVSAVAQDSIVFPTRTMGNEGTAIATEVSGEAERLFQAEKERERVKAEQERLAREAAERKAAEEARRAAEAAAAAKAAELQARISGAKSPGELLALSDELKSQGDVDGSRAALRAIVARYPEHRYADMAVSMLTGQTVPAAAVPAAAVAAAPAPAPVASTPAASGGMTCMAVLTEFSAARPPLTGGVSTAEREVFYGNYYVKILDAAPACRTDTITARTIREGVQRNVETCKKDPNANCTVGVPDAPVGTVDAAYERVIAKAQAATPPAVPADPSPTTSTEPRQ